ncbi:MAG: alpha/beta hydrolase [Desulfobacterales bacterium]|jgi:pimeloyl-ACP methyl ester carboxylesterase|nr:alpha/beta hydrolase [Desulfobacterales bacterium]
MKRTLGPGALAALLLLCACATPVGVRYVDSKEANRRLTETVLSADTLSAPTLQIIERAALTGTLRTDPGAAIAALHRGLPTLPTADRLFALAEICFQHAGRGGAQPYYLAAAAYAYAFLFPPAGRLPPEPFDPRLRTAVDLYNQGIANGFTESGSRRVDLRPGTFPLPFGELVLRTDPEEFRWGPFRLVEFANAAELSVRGLRNDYRWPGIGAPLVATLKHVPGERVREYLRVPSSLKVAATALLRFDDAVEGLRTGRMTAQLSLFTPQEGASAELAGRRVPLEYRQSAALASTLEGSQVYSLELKGLLSGDFALLKQSPRFKDNVFLMAPYTPGRIPLVLVHGTASSPARWAELLNEVLNDPELWHRYQVWLFTYNTGNPVLFSAGILARGLRSVVAELDPEGADAALRKMVVVGHSQGGLLAKLTAVESGERFREQALTVPIERLDVSPETRELLERSFIYTPLPFVRRIIFICTPHRGSFLVSDWVSDLLRKAISLPFAWVEPLGEIFERSPEALATQSVKKIAPRSTDNMNPNSPFIRTFASLPIAPPIRAHSIIAVANPEAPPAEWDDGVVAYHSAHIEGVASELIVHHGHSAQEAPQAIEEVRRILIENLNEP